MTEDNGEAHKILSAVLSAALSF